MPTIWSLIWACLYPSMPHVSPPNTPIPVLSAWRLWYVLPEEQSHSVLHWWSFPEETKNLNAMPLPCRWVSQKCVCVCVVICLCICAAVHDYASLPKKDLICEYRMSSQSCGPLKNTAFYRFTFYFKFINCLTVCSYCFWLLRLRLWLRLALCVA